MNRLMIAIALFVKWSAVAMRHYPKTPVGALWHFAWRMAGLKELSRDARRLRDRIKKAAVAGTHRR